MQNKWLKRKTPHNCSASAGTIKKPFSIGNVNGTVWYATIYITEKKGGKRTLGKSGAINSYIEHEKAGGSYPTLCVNGRFAFAGSCWSSHKLWDGLQPLRTTDWLIPVSITKLKLLKLLKRAHMQQLLSLPHLPYEF